MEARKQALAADVVVVNHHLFFADLVLRDEGVAELLPACNTVIFDEAHQLPDTASLFFGESLSTAQLLELARDTRLEAAAAAKDFAALPEAAQAWTGLHATCAWPQATTAGGRPRQQAQSRSEFAERLDAVAQKLAALGKLLEFQAERSEGLENCWHRVPIWRAGCRAGANPTRRHRPRTAGTGQGPEVETVRWVEVFQHAVQLNSTPLSIAEMFQRQIEDGARAWIFTSATLSVKQDFSHYQQEMGLAGARTAGVGQPLRLSQPGAAVCARAHAGPQQSRATPKRSSGRCCR